MKKALIILLAILSLSSLLILVLDREEDTDRILLRWVTGFSAAKSSYAELFNELQDRYEIRIDPDNTGTQKILVQISSGIGPDLFDAFGQQALQVLVAAGVVENLEPHFERAGFDFEANTYLSSQQWMRYNDGIWGYPTNITSLIMFYNKDVFDQFDLPYPDELMTWEAFFELMREMRRRADQAGANIVPAARLRWLQFFNSLVGHFTSEDGTRLLLTDEPMTRAMTLHRQAIFEDRIALRAVDAMSISAEAGAGGGAADLTLFMNGFYGVIFIGKHALIDFRMDYLHRQRLRERGEEIQLPRIGVALTPHFEGYDPNYLAMGRAIAVSAITEHKEGAAEFVKYMASEAYSELINELLDSIPGNPRYASAGLTELIPELPEIKAHDISLKALNNSYSFRVSDFIFLIDIQRTVGEVMQRIESNPSLDVVRLLENAERDLYRLMERNLRRDPLLRERYRELTGYSFPSEWIQSISLNSDEKKN